MRLDFPQTENNLPVWGYYKMGTFPDRSASESHKKASNARIFERFDYIIKQSFSFEQNCIGVGRHL